MKITTNKHRGIGVIAGAVVLLVVLVVPAVLPWLTGGLAEIPDFYVTSVPDDVRGAYAITDRGVMQLFGWTMIMRTAPDEAPTFALDEFQGLAVVMPNPDTADAYHLISLATGERIAWQSAVQDGQRLMLDPGPLGAGDYLLEVATGSLFGAATYHYFHLR